VGAILYWDGLIGTGGGLVEEGGESGQDHVADVGHVDWIHLKKPVENLASGA
jgi:hypothetical protein